MNSDVPTLLIVDDEKTTREGLRDALSERYDVYLAEDAGSAMQLLEEQHFDVLLTDFRLPSEDGMKLITRAKSLAKPPICILMTAYGSEELAVDAMKLGAYDFLAKPVDPARLKNIITNAARQRGTERELEVTRRKLRDTGLLGKLVGTSKKMQEVYSLVEMVAPSSASGIGPSKVGLSCLSPRPFVTGLSCHG